MHPERLAELRSFFVIAETRIPDIVGLMYGRLFEAMPSAALLFKGDMQEQTRQFAFMLQTLIHLTRSSQLWPVSAGTGEALLPEVESLGRRHAHADVRPKHFEAMKEVLSQCLREMFPDDFTPSAEKALAFIFDVVSRSAARPGPMPREKKQPGSEKGTGLSDLRRFFELAAL